MALAIPASMSPAGVDTEITLHDVNGFAPRTERQMDERIIITRN